MHKVKTDVEKQKDEEEYRKWMSGHKGGCNLKGFFWAKISKIFGLCTEGGNYTV